MKNSYVLIYLVLAWISGGVTEESAERILTLSGAVTETVDALGYGDSLVGIDASSQAPGDRPGLPRVGYYRMLSAEGVLSLRPTLVIGTEDAGPSHVLSQIQDAGIRVELVSAEKSLEGAIARIQHIGKLLDEEEEAKVLMRPLEKHLQEKKIGIGPDAPKVVFLFGRGGGVPNVAGQQTGAEEIIRLAGGKNAVQGFTGYRALTPEALIVASPDYILTTSATFEAIGGPASVWELPGIGMTPAGKHKRLVVLDDHLLLGFGPRTAIALAPTQQ